jgi:predicted RNA binding protein YcfA (HicA-like mRNA interferase family)
MKRTKLLKYLHGQGCRFLREGGNHTIYTVGDGMRKSAVPRHPEIKPGIVRKICKGLGIAAPDEK